VQSAFFLKTDKFSKKSFAFFFIVAPWFLIYVQFTHQQMHFFILKNTLKFTLKYT